MTPAELQTMALMRIEIKDLQRQNTILQRIAADQSATMAALWEAMQIATAKKKKQSH